MGVVYEARHARTGSRVAVKVLNHKEADNPELQARFEREAMLGSRLGHEHIVQVIDFQSTDQGFPYLVMELLEGEDLRRRLRRDGPMSLVKAASITRQVALALCAAHDEGVIHRDLKPENIFLARRNAGGEVIKVLDFGLSKVMLSVTMATQEGQVLGTPNFMSPEQARGRNQEVDPRTDIFALGLVLYNMLSGQMPFSAENLPTLLYKVVHEQPRPLCEFRGDLPPALMDLVDRATAKEKEDRHASADELLADLTQSLGSRWQDVLLLEVTGAPAAREVSKPSVDMQEKSRPPSPQHGGKLQGIMGLILVVLLVCAGGWLAFQHLRGTPAPRPAPASRPAPAAGSDAAPAPDAAPVPDAALASHAEPVPDTVASPAPDAARPHGAAQGARVRRPLPARASLSVVSLHEGRSVEATVRFNGAPAPSTPTLFTGLKPGTHLLQVQAAGYEPSTHRVILKPGERGRLVVGLKRE